MGLYKGRRKPNFKNYHMLGNEMVLKCEEWTQLSPCAKVLYLCIKAKHNGTNNGNIVLHYSELKAVRGLSSPVTASKAFAELEKQGWIKRSGLGGLYRIPNKYYLTGKYDGYIWDRSHTVPEKYKESTLSVVQTVPPVGNDAYGPKIYPPKRHFPEPESTTESVAIDSRKCS